MDSEIIYLALAALACGLALNLKLTLSVLHTSRRERHVPAPLLPGMRVPAVAGRALGRPSASRPLAGGQANALLFLSSKCPKCRTKLAELEALLPAALRSGLAVWLVSDEPAWRLRRFLGTSFPSSQVWRLDARDYRALNPAGASPAYLFVSHDGLVQAGGLIGDEDWLALGVQLRRAEAAAA